jgi:hypothetical protein
MKRPTFLGGVGVALAASIAGGVLFAMLSSVFTRGPALHVIIAGLGLGYILYLLRHSGKRIGRLSVVSLWAVVAVIAWFAAPSLWSVIAAHLGLIWLVRSLYFHGSVLIALADLGLVVVGLMAAIWAVRQAGGSLVPGLWCFFLVQALFVMLPANLQRRDNAESAIQAEDAFQHAHRAARAAVRRLSSMR